MLLAEHEDMVQTLVPCRADEAFHEGILPRALGRREPFDDPHARHALPKGVAEQRADHEG